jgi:hypothetical protein
MNNKVILLIMVSVFTTLACKFIMFLIPISLCLILLATVLYFEYAKENRLKEDKYEALTLKLKELEERFNKAGLKALIK